MAGIKTWTRREKWTEAQGSHFVVNGGFTVSRLEVVGGVGVFLDEIAEERCLAAGFGSDLHTAWRMLRRELSQVMAAKYAGVDLPKSNVMGERL